MIWDKSFIYIPQYKLVSTNQHGERYKQVGAKKLSMTTITAITTDAIDLHTLILLSHHLDTPVRYDFDSKPQRAYIEVVSREQLQKNQRLI